MGGVPLAYGAAARASAENAVYYSADWTRENISSKGALGAFFVSGATESKWAPDDIFDYFGLSGFTADQLRAKGYIVWTPPRSKANSSLKATLSPTWFIRQWAVGIPGRNVWRLGGNGGQLRHVKEMELLLAHPR